jgi:gluconolactonase
MFSPCIQVIEPEFKKLALMNTRLENLWSGGRWLEGPVWFGDGRYLLFSDIPNNRLMRYDDTNGLISTFRQPSMQSNGNTRDHSGRLITCEHGGRRVTRTEFDGALTILATEYEGRQLNSPNDVVVAKDGSIWFTDPTYGIDSNYEGHMARSAIGGNHVYRLDLEKNKLTAMLTDFVQPNGLAFSPDGKFLYVADTGLTHSDNGPRHIRRFRLADTTVLESDTIFATCDAGLFDGFKVDCLGNIWTSTGAGVYCFNSKGILIGKILVPEVVSNVCFGGEKSNRLFICATTTLYSIYLNVPSKCFAG